MRNVIITGTAALWLALLPAGGLLAQDTISAQPQVAAIAGDASYLSSPELLRRGLGALLERAGPQPVISRLSVEADHITLVTQSAEAAYHGDEWTVSRLRILFYDSDQVSGPRPARDSNIVAKAEGGFFPLADVPLDRLDSLLAAALRYAGIEGQAQVTGIELARAVSILPMPRFGAVRWTIRLASAREQATVYANADGRIIGGDLSGTTRAQRMNLLEEDAWPMAEAQLALASVAGGAPVHEIEISPRSVSLTIEDPANPKMTETFSWDISGLRKGFGGMPNYIALGMGDRAAFALSDVDLGKLPDIKAAAITAYGAPGATITGMQAIRPTDRPGAQQVLWDVDFREANNETGEVFVDPAGKILVVNLPESRRPPMGPWMAPDTIVATFKRLEETFGPTARYSQIMLGDRGGTVVVEDPGTPGQLAEFIIDETRIFRFGTLMPLKARLDETRSFTLPDIAALDLARIREFETRTLERMGKPDLAITRYTISRAALIMDPSDSRLLVEIRAEKDQGWSGGRVTYDLDGREVDVVMP